MAFFLLLFLAGLSSPGQSDEIRCYVCGELVTRRYYRGEDKVEGGSKNICAECAQLSTRCFACSLPVNDAHEKLLDGRIMCKRDHAAGVFSDDDLRHLAEEARQEINAIFTGHFAISGQNMTVKVSDQVELQRIFRSPGHSLSCGSVYGATRSRQALDRTYFHSIDILDGLPRNRIKAVAAHELAHTWLAENIHPERKLSGDAVEGFCEFVAHKLMEKIGSSAEQKVIEESIYTRGQIRAFLEAEKHAGLGTLLAWMRSGADDRLNPAEIQRVHLFQNSSPEPSSPSAAPSPAPRAAAPSDLVLQSLFGGKSNRMATINRCIFRTGETKEVQVGESVVAVTCHEIRAESVIVTTGGSKAKRELFLPSARGAAKP